MTITEAIKYLRSRHSTNHQAIAELLEGIGKIEFEIFSDPAYFDTWALRPKGANVFNKTLHFDTEEQAQHAAQVINYWTWAVLSQPSKEYKR